MLFDTTDVASSAGVLDESIIVTEEVIVITETGPFEVELELIPYEQDGDRR